MVKVGLVDTADMRNLLHIIENVLPNTLGARCTMQDVVSYNHDVMTVLEMEPRYPTLSKEKGQKGVKEALICWVQAEAMS